MAEPTDRRRGDGLKHVLDVFSRCPAAHHQPEPAGSEQQPCRLHRSVLQHRASPAPGQAEHLPGGGNQELHPSPGELSPPPAPQKPKAQPSITLRCRSGVPARPCRHRGQRRPIPGGRQNKAAAAPRLSLLCHRLLRGIKSCHPSAGFTTATSLGFSAGGGSGSYNLLFLGYLPAADPAILAAA